MKKKYVMYGLLPAFALALGVGGAASARGMFGFGLNNLTPEQMVTQQQTMFQRHADLLGISVEEAKNAWAEGKPIQQLANERGISPDQLRLKMHEKRKQEMKSWLSTLVQKGVITQAQADRRAQLIDQLQPGSMRGNGVSRGHGQGMGMHLGY